MLSNMQDVCTMTILNSLNSKFNTDDLRHIEVAIRKALSAYEIKPKEVALTTYHYTLPEEYKAFMVAKKIAGMSNNTLYIYKLYMEEMLYYFSKPITNISTNDIRIFLYEIQQKRNLSNRSLDARRSALMSFFSWCSCEGFIPKNPMSTIKPIKYEITPVSPLSDLNLEQVRNACKDCREKAVIEFLYSTGCRVGELASLHLTDINFESREVKVVGKGNKHRVCYLSARAVLALKEYIKTKPCDSDMDAIIVTSRAPYARVKESAIQDIVKKVGIRCGIPDLHCHQLRHTMATEALKNGMSITDLQRLLGHTNINTTTIYAKTNLEAVKLSHSKYL